MDLVYEQPQYLHWLWLLAVPALLGAWRLLGVRGRLERFADRSLLPRLVPAWSPGRAWLRLAVALGALALVGVAMADPRWGVVVRTIPQRGLDVLVLLDVSRSMLARDARPSRLEHAREAITDLLDHLGADRAGLMVFAGDTSLVCPLTLSRESFLAALREASVRGGVRGGTMLGDAIRAAASGFLDEIPEGKVIVIATDGEDHGSLPVEAAAMAFDERGIRIITIGIGDDTVGAPVPEREGDTRSFVTDDTGAEVRSVMNAALLRDVALAAEGAFIPLGTATGDVGAVFDRLVSGMELRESETGPIRQHIPRYQLFVGAALILLLADAMVRGGRRLPPREEAYS